MKGSKPDRERHILISFIHGIFLKKVKPIETEGKKVVARGWGWGSRKRLVKVNKVSALKCIRSEDLM